MLFSTLRRRERNRLKNSGTGRGCGERTCPGGLVGTEPGPVPCLTPPLQFSPSITLRLYLREREFSLDAVAMTTLLTKTSFCGGGWLTQKLRVLGKGVHSDECICRAFSPFPTQILRTVSDFTGLRNLDPPSMNVE